jgi:hypothetical protein
MNVKVLSDTPPWEWPKNAAKILRDALTNRHTAEDDRVTAAELAGDLVVMNDDLAGVLLGIVEDSSEPEQLRARAAISFGPVLDQADIDGFEDPDDVPISEKTFNRIQASLERLAQDERVPKEVRRRVLEASVRAPQDWHQSAIRTAFETGDREWVLTAVFAMRWIRGFDEEILQSLKSTDPETHFEAVSAAGARELDAAWPHVLDLVENARTTPRPLLLAAIEAVGSIRSREAATVLGDLTESRDEEIAEAAEEAIMMAEAMPDEDDDDEAEDKEEWIN